MMVRVSGETLSESLQQGFGQFASAMGQNIAQAIVYRKSIGEAMQEAAASTLESLAAQSLTYAIYAAALGFIRLAEWDFGAAAEAFTAAAIFGSVGAAEAVAGREIAPQQKSADAGAAASTGSSGGTAPSSAATGSQASGTTVQVYVSGPIIGPSGIEELTSMINDAVEHRDVRLVASRTLWSGALAK